MRTSPQPIPREILKREAQGFLIFAAVYGLFAGIHFRFGSPRIREVERQVMFAAGLAVICYLLVVLFRLRSLRK